MTKSRANRLALVAGLIAVGGMTVSPAIAQQATPSASATGSGSVLRAGTDAQNVTNGNPNTAVTPGRTAASPDSVAGIPVNYDESLIPAYEIPDPQKFNNGAPVRNAAPRSSPCSRRTSTASRPAVRRT